MPIRQSNFELLRILCALFIIAGHIINVHGPGEYGSSSWYISTALRPWFVCAVNTFILLSGYFGIKLKAWKMWMMNDMVTFYSLLIFIITLVCKVVEIDNYWDIRNIILLSFPVISKQYWFITVYFALCLLSPALNFFSEQANKSLFRDSLIIGICLFIILPTIAYGLNFQTITDDAGYGIMNFCLLYLLGRYIHYYDPLKQISCKACLLVYFGASACCGLFQIIYSHLLGFSFTSYISYNTLFVFIASIGIFAAFQKIPIKQSPIINKLSSFCLCSYVIHAHPIMFKYIFADVFGIPSLSGWQYIISIFLLPIVVYCFCVIIESVRRYFIQRNVEKILSKIPYFADI